MRKITLNITGMSCGHCLNAVNQALGRLDSVRSTRSGSGGQTCSTTKR